MNDLKVDSDDILSIDYESKKVRLYKAPNRKPIINYWKSGDPCLKLDILKYKLSKDLPDFNVIRTKNISDDFLNLCLNNKHNIFLHVVISGLNSTIFEPNIPPVRHIFYQLKKLIDNGFPQKQILVIVDPILPNDNGKKILELLLRVFTEFKELRLRYIRFRQLTYTRTDDGKYVPGNFNISKRNDLKKVIQYLNKTQESTREYYKMIDKYSTIIYIDKGDDALIGIRELGAFNMRNEYIDETGYHKIIEYEKNNKYKPIVNTISGSNVRCRNRCILCPFYG